MELCYVYCRDLSDHNSEFHSLPLVRMAKILSEAHVSLHVIAVGEFDRSTLREQRVTVHRYDRWAPTLGIISLYLQLCVLTAYVGYREDIDGFSNIWAHYHLVPVLVAARILGMRVFARTFGMGTLWDRMAATRVLQITRPREMLDTVLKRALNRAEAWLLNRTDGVYTNAETVRDRLVAQGVVPGHCTVVSQGVDTDFFRPGCVDRQPRILFVGRISAANKRLSDAYAVYRRLSSIRPDVSLVIAGDGTPPDHLQEKLEEENIVRLGYLDQHRLRTEYQRATLLLVTSEQEGVPNVVLEAQACGLPIVATAAGDISRIIDESDGGIVQQVGDIDSLTASAQTLFTDERCWQTHSKNARSYVEQHHAFDALREPYVEFFTASDHS